MFKFLLSAAVLSASMVSQAAIVDLGKVTRDTATGLDWLDLTETRGLAYDDVVAQMDKGGDLSPAFRSTTTVRFPINLRSRGSHDEEETVYRRTDYCLAQGA